MICCNISRVDKKTEKNLKEILINFLDMFDANDVHNYFAIDFDDDLKYFREINDEVIDFLINENYELDCNYCSGLLSIDEFEEKTKKMLEDALMML